MVYGFNGDWQKHYGMARAIHPISYAGEVRLSDSTDLYARQKISDGSKILDFDLLHYGMRGTGRSFHYLATITFDTERNAKFELAIRPLEQNGVLFSQHGKCLKWLLLIHIATFTLLLYMLQCIHMLTIPFHLFPQEAPLPRTTF
mgnify:CR=1 FL=1